MGSEHYQYLKCDPRCLVTIKNCARTLRTYHVQGLGFTQHCPKESEIKHTTRVNTLTGRYSKMCVENRNVNNFWPNPSPHNLIKSEFLGPGLKLEVQQSFFLALCVSKINRPFMLFIYFAL